MMFFKEGGGRLGQKFIYSEKAQKFEETPTLPQKKAKAKTIWFLLAFLVHHRTQMFASAMIFEPSFYQLNHSSLVNG